jgi:hypothetical protein
VLALGRIHEVIGDGAAALGDARHRVDDVTVKTGKEAESVLAWHPRVAASVAR